VVTIYLADLTHCTIVISNDTFPLNIGLVGAYAKKCFPDLHIELFKYPQELKKAIDRKPPDILGCSNYPWNFQLGVFFFKYVKNINKKVITVMGGPNVSYIEQKQHQMLDNLKGILDFHTLHEGESAFRSLLEVAFANDFNIKKMKEAPVRGCLCVEDDKIQEFIPIEREKNLTEFPSPYLTGLMDKFFNDRFSPMIETHRGCPFQCAYCHEGHKGYNIVYRHEISRIYDELEYIFTRIGKRVKNFMITDPNFGIFKEDINIAKKIRQLYEKTGYPNLMFASTSKNKKDNLIEISKVLRPIEMPIWFSVQSMTDKVLERINRKNINVAKMASVQTGLQKENISSQSEVIMCLPCETFQTHLETLVQMIKLQVDQIAYYQLMLIQGAEIEKDELFRRKYFFSTKFRTVPRGFSDIEGVGRPIETEEIVVATKDFPFEDYLRTRQIHLLLSVYYNGRAFKGFFKCLIEYGLDIRKFMLNLLDLFMENPEAAEILNSFTSETKSELFESEDAIKSYYAQDDNFKKLLNGIVGANLLQKYVCQLYMGKSHILSEPIRKAAAMFLPEDKVFQCKLKNIARFYELSFKHFLSQDRREMLTKGYFDYNIADWLNSLESLDNFKNNRQKEVFFHTPEEQFKIVESYFERYGRDFQAFGKILTSRLWISDMSRKPKK